MLSGTRFRGDFEERMKSFLEDAVRILKGLCSKYEELRGLLITDEAVRAAVDSPTGIFRTGSCRTRRWI